MPRREYPVLIADPSVAEAFACARISDYLFIGGVTGGSWVLGFLRGRPVRHTAAGVMGTLGLTFGAMYTLQSCRNRLLGLEPNLPEQKKYTKNEIA